MWVHYAVTYDLETVSFFRNGELVGKSMKSGRARIQYIAGLGGEHHASSVAAFSGRINNVKAPVKLTNYLLLNGLYAPFHLHVPPGDVIM